MAFCYSNICYLEYLFLFEYCRRKWGHGEKLQRQKVQQQWCSRGARREGRVLPLTVTGKEEKNGEKKEKSGRTGKNWEGCFTLPSWQVHVELAMLLGNPRGYLDYFFRWGVGRKSMWNSICDLAYIDSHTVCIKYARLQEASKIWPLETLNLS